MHIDEIIQQALLEDIGDGDHTTLSTVPIHATRSAVMIAKQKGVLCGVQIAEKVFKTVDPNLCVDISLSDGAILAPGDVIMRISGKARSILIGERAALNFIQRMCGIATATNKMLQQLDGLKTRLLDTRKTTPLLRGLEKYAVKCGGGENHRFGLFDMILIKDNHVDFAGGIVPAIQAVSEYLSQTRKKLPIEIEVRNFDELQDVLNTGAVDRIMLDNFTPEQLKKAVELINHRYATEASGGITEENIRQYAETGVDYISVGALTHHIQSLDISLIAAQS